MLERPVSLFIEFRVIANRAAFAGAAATVTSDALMNPFDGMLSITAYE